MSEAVRETFCTSCTHREVCKHKENYLKVCEAAFNTKINEPCENGFRSVPITNFECVTRIEVHCKYYLERCIVLPQML